MTVLIWMALGLMVGLLASKRFHHTSSAVALDVALSVAGAVAGGAAINSLGIQQPDVFVAAGLFGAAVGSVAMLVGYRTIFHEA